MKSRITAYCFGDRPLEGRVTASRRRPLALEWGDQPGSNSCLWTRCLSVQAHESPSVSPTCKGRLINTVSLLKVVPSPLLVWNVWASPLAPCDKICTAWIRGAWVAPVDAGLVTQSCLTLRYTTYVCSVPGSSVHWILQARMLEWVAMPSSSGSSQPRDRTGSPALQADSFPAELPGKPNHRWFQMTFLPFPAGAWDHQFHPAGWEDRPPGGVPLPFGVRWHLRQEVRGAVLRPRGRGAQEGPARPDRRVHRGLQPRERRPLLGSLPVCAAAGGWGAGPAAHAQVLLAARAALLGLPKGVSGCGPAE